MVLKAVITSTHCSRQSRQESNWEPGHTVCAMTATRHIAYIRTLLTTQDDILNCADSSLQTAGGPSSQQVKHVHARGGCEHEDGQDKHIKCTSQGGVKC